jgi:hypothetical protein
VFEIGRRELQGLGAEQPSLVIKLLRVVVADTAKRLDALLGRVAATTAWALDLDRHLHALPLAPEETERA